MHHVSLFLTGSLLGLSIPALASGIYQSRWLRSRPQSDMNRLRYQGFQPHIRAGIPGWDALLFVYGILFIPVFLLVLLGTDILVWALIRVNFVFIFGS